jgi:cytochrome c oxidase subunit 2
MIDDQFRLFPAAASEHASHVDLLYAVLLLISGFFTIVISLAIVYLSIKYRRGNKKVDRSETGKSFTTIEMAWMALLLVIAVGLFFWGARLYVVASESPPNALEVQVVGKQWMWKFQHSNGRREINELHVPVGRAVRLNMISEDVIHSLFVPVFRIKQDVLPGRYSSCWFAPTKPGSFHLFCAEYCGTNHSRMTGAVHVLEPAEYEAWLAGRRSDETPVESGLRLFNDLRCVSCHLPGGTVGRCPRLDHLVGRPVRLTNGTTVTADDNYLRESILRPQAKIVEGFEPLMPSFESQLNEEQLLHLLAYIKSLSPTDAAPQEPKAAEARANDAAGPSQPKGTRPAQ